MACRFDYVIIWGNGLHVAEDILSIVRDTPELEIQKIVRHRPPDIGEFVRRVYERDYVPFRHLVEKTRYLLQTRPDVLVVFLRNSDPREHCVGEGVYRHIESAVIRKLKDDVRNQFNPRQNGSRTEEHVIHASDHEAQTDHVLHLLGYRDGIGHLRRSPNPIIKAPFHLPVFHGFRIRKISWPQLHCTLLDGTPENLEKRVCRVEESPHFQFLCGDRDAYHAYWNRFRGHVLCDDHSPKNLQDLADEFHYLERPHEHEYIIVRELEHQRFLIQDGLHRASIVRTQAEDGIIAAVMQ